MSDYWPPLEDMQFVLAELVDLGELCTLPNWDHADPDDVRGLLEEWGRFVRQEVAPTNRLADRTGCALRNGEVAVPEVLRGAYEQLATGGWFGVPFPSELGGGQLPWAVWAATQELALSANASLSLLIGLTQGGIELLLEHGTEEDIQRYVPNLVSGRWSATMCLTEPHAGSDIGLLRMKAERCADGTYRLTGTKIFITFGEHDLTENIIHLVLARIPGSPAGSKGLGLFLVPKFLVDEEGKLGPRNDVRCVSIEDKLGIHASPTCVLSFGDSGEGAVGYLIGKEGEGVRQMFTMMNSARIAIGISGLAIAERAYQKAVRYALERRQGRSLRATNGSDPVAIIEHPDVRRMLLTMRSQIEAMRALLYFTAGCEDRSRFHTDAEVRRRNKRRLALLTPIAKAWCTDVGHHVTSMALQVFGGAGYIEETGIAQLFRDSRIGSIYEGTNGIQALDLLARKLPMDGGAPIRELMDDLRQTLRRLSERERTDDSCPFGAMRRELQHGVEALNKATGWLFENGLRDLEGAAAGAVSYQNMLGTILGAQLLAESAMIAADRLETEQPEEASRFLQAKIVTARFYAEHLLPAASALVGPVTRGKETLFSMPDDAW